MKNFNDSIIIRKLDKIAQRFTAAAWIMFFPSKNNFYMTIMTKVKRIFVQFSVKGCTEAFMFSQGLN